MKELVVKLAAKIWTSNRLCNKPCINLSTWAFKMQSLYKTNNNSRNSSQWWSSSRCLLRSNQRSSVMSVNIIRAHISRATRTTSSYSNSTSRCKLHSKLCKQLSSSSSNQLDKSHNLWRSLSRSCSNSSLSITNSNSNNLSLLKQQSSSLRIISTSRIHRPKQARLQVNNNHSTLSSIRRLRHQLIWILTCSNISKLWCLWPRRIAPA